MSLSRLWASWAPFGTMNRVMGIMQTNPTRLIYPKLKGGRFALPSPLRMYPTVPGRETVRPKATDVPIAFNREKPYATRNAVKNKPPLIPIIDENIPISPIALHVMYEAGNLLPNTKLFFLNKFSAISIIRTAKITLRTLPLRPPASHEPNKDPHAAGIASLLKVLMSPEPCL